MVMEMSSVWVKVAPPFHPDTRLLLLLVPISKAVMLTQLLRISYDVIRRSLVFKWHVKESGENNLMEFHIVPFPSTICYTHCMLCLATHIACLAALNGDGDVLCLGESCSAISSGYPATTAAGSHLEGRYVNAIITHFL